MNTKIKTLTVKLSDAEIGRNAKLEHVRKEQAILPVHPAYAEAQPWRQAIRVMGHRFKYHFGDFSGDGVVLDALRSRYKPRFPSPASRLRYTCANRAWSAWAMIPAWRCAATSP